MNQAWIRPDITGQEERSTELHKVRDDRLNYRIDEFVEEVMRQIKDFVIPGEEVQFELELYNSKSPFATANPDNEGLCVICGRENVRQGLKHSPKIRFSVKMREFIQRP